MRSFILAAVLSLCALSTAHAEKVFPPISDPVVRAECSDCHMLYQPEMLTKIAWTKMMNGLSDHFGDDASLAPVTVKVILAYYLANAADVTTFKDANRFTRNIDPANPPLKITDTPRFHHKHERISQGVWKRKNIGFKGNCVGCHLDAAKGDYDKVAENLMYKWVDK